MSEHDLWDEKMWRIRDRIFERERSVIVSLFWVVFLRCMNHRNHGFYGLHGLPLLPSTALSKQGLAMSLVNEFVDLLLSEPLIFVIQ